MGLQRAIEAHRVDDLVEAERQYQRAFDQKKSNAVLFQNYGSLLALIGKHSQAEIVYRRGLEIHPNNHQINRNFANLLRKSKPSASIQLYVKTLKLICADQQLFSTQVFQDVASDVIDVLHSLQLNTWAYAVLRDVISSSGITTNLLRNLVLVADQLGESFQFSKTNQVIDLLFNDVLAQSCSLVDQMSLYFGFAFHYHSLDDNPKALLYYDKGMAVYLDNKSSFSSEENTLAQKLVNQNSWNFSCIKLKMGDFGGWPLFDHGLLAPAIGQQKWQRALTKPFSDKEILIWRGQDLMNKRLLVLEEQAIGDAMMFLTLIPDLLNKVSHIGIFISKRLLPIYKRSFHAFVEEGRLSIYTKSDVESNILHFSMFDYMTAIGSICQYLYSDFSGLRRLSSYVKSDSRLTAKLRKRYHSCRPFTSHAPFLVGVSWRGGGRADRIKQKSIEVDQFLLILQSVANVRFVSLQYGESQSQCDAWLKSGVDIVCDGNINPLKNMDSWLSQVDSCDAVLSVANTTIHGAGGLNKPTLCLLSNHSDWRWLDDETVERSYWYPSVGIARQGADGDWNSAISIASTWISEGCPYPKGPQTK